MTRETSKQAFEEIRDKMAPGLRRKIYSMLMVRSTPRTSGEIAQALPEYQINSVSTRLSEMRKLGLVRECPTRPCNVTGHNVLTYEAMVPIQPSAGLPVRHRRTRQQIQAKVDELVAKYNDDNGFNCSFAKGAASALNWVLCHHHMDLASYNA